MRRDARLNCIHNQAFIIHAILQDSAHETQGVAASAACPGTMRASFANSSVVTTS